jgi:hypothetical protein
MTNEEVSKQIQALNEKFEKEMAIRKKLENDVILLQEDVINRKVEILNLEQQLTESINTKADDLSIAVQKAQDTANDAVNRANNAQVTANDAVNRADAAQDTANDAVNRANNAQDTANTARSEISSAVNGIQNGSIVAYKATISQKALMLRARNNNHWLVCNGIDSKNFDCFGLWTTDNKWYNLIRVGATGDLPRGSVREGAPELSSI